MAQSQYYLPVIGRLDEKLEFKIWPFFHIPAPKKLVEIKESSLSATLRDKEGKSYKNKLGAFLSMRRQKQREGVGPYRERIDPRSKNWPVSALSGKARRSINPAKPHRSANRDITKLAASLRRKGNSMASSTSEESPCNMFSLFQQRRQTFERADAPQKLLEPSILINCAETSAGCNWLPMESITPPWKLGPFRFR